MAINSYHLAILEATDDGAHMDLADCWRTYHIVSDMCDCELEIDEDLPGRVRPNETLAAARPGAPKILYVPVTRKVTDTDDSKAHPITHETDSDFDLGSFLNEPLGDDFPTLDDEISDFLEMTFDHG